MKVTRNQLLQMKSDLRRLNLDSQKMIESIIKRSDRIKQDQKIVERIETEIFLIAKDIDNAENELGVSGELLV
jgi:hypothetical protein